MINFNTYKKQNTIGLRAYGISNHSQLNPVIMKTSSNVSIWKQIEKSNYEINSKGVVRNRKTKKIISQHQGGTSPYFQVNIRKQKGVRKMYLVHRLIAKYFIPNPYNKPVVNHKDGDKLNNSIDNLEWVTYSENLIHAQNTGLTKRFNNQNYKGKFGVEHNRSIAYTLKMPNGKIKFFGSGLEFKRETGLDNSSLSYARSKKLINGISEYTFVYGKMKGITIYSEDSPHFEKGIKI